MRPEDYRATLILMIGLLAAALTGFLREAALAYELGASHATDLYLIAFALPEFVFVALPIILLPAFIPFFTDLQLGTGEAGAWHFARQVASALLVLLLGVTALAAVGAPLYLRWLAPGFDPLQRSQALQALLVMLPALSMMGGATLAGAILQICHRFARPALATAIYNVTFVIVLLGAPLGWSVGRAAWGVTAGAAAAFLLQFSLVWRFRPKPSAKDAERKQLPLPVSVSDLARVAGPLAAGYAMHHVILFVDRAMATTLAAGAVATLNYSYRLALVVGQLSGLAISTALFPRMAAQAGSQDYSGLRSSLAAALRFVWLVGVPACGGLIVLRIPLVQVLFERGAFNRSATIAVSEVLIWYALAVLADALCQPLWRVLYARRRARTVLAVNSLQTGIRVLVNIALIDLLGYRGLALSAAVGLTVQLLVLGQVVRRQLGPFLAAEWWRQMFRVVLATALAVLVTSLMVSHSRAWPALSVLLAGAALGSLTYVGALRLQEKRLW